MVDHGRLATEQQLTHGYRTGTLALGEPTIDTQIVRESKEQAP